VLPGTAGWTSAETLDGVGVGHQANDDRLVCSTNSKGTKGEYIDGNLCKVRAVTLDVLVLDV